MDHHVGRLLQELGALGRDDDTYVLFTSDHGEELWDRGLFNHGHSLYEEQIWVPLICAGPDLPPRVVERSAAAVDVMPTLAGLLGVEADNAWQGKTVAPFLAGRQADAAPSPCCIQGTNFTASEPQQTTISSPYKLIRFAESGRIELYDLARDPREQHNLAKAEPRRADALEEQLADWAASFPSGFEPVETLDGDQAEMLERLRAVGYLGE